ncbi:ubiquitin carboxyl-terminal hydrolase 47 isoform X2 [Brachionus plicatilis]|uniref:Ubiquitin carboxyl-terminal hydrolase 47 isoform X2 n=1 Tax=Brachionus plicatilis TaxID=10195 RepID=A0A3M7P1R3_BRAPC|nr:ubiquitin carboxyl-terminal hydrolase 47 isoform X2 [Brachionus plicatilis]
MVRIDSSYQNFKNKTFSNTLEICPTNHHSNVCFTCILIDMTDPMNTCRRHAITLSGSCTPETLVKEASAQYSYEPDSFNLMWKGDNQLLNISEIQSTSLADLGLSSTSKNIFEIHEKEGPPKRLKRDDFSFPSPNHQMTIFDDDSRAPGSESFSPSRRNACSNTVYGPVNSSLPSFSLFEEDNNGYVGLINQAMTCYLNSLLQTLYMTPEFRNGIYRQLLKLN